MTATSLDLSQIKTDALSSAATFRTLIGLGSSDAVTFKEATLTSGTVTSSTPVINATQTWNDGATTFTGALLNITDTASASASLLMDLQVGGSSKYSVRKDSQVAFSGVAWQGKTLVQAGYTTTGWGLSGGNWYWGSGTSANAWKMGLHSSHGVQIFQEFGFAEYAGVQSTLVLLRDAANTLAQRNGTNAQTFRLYNTYTSSTSFENLQLQWNTNEARIGTSVGSAGGTQRDVVFGSWDSAGTWNPALTITPQGVPTFSMGTVTSSQPFTINQTWNEGATTFTGALLNVTDTASASGSLLMDLQVGGSSKFKIRKDGFIFGAAASFNTASFYQVNGNQNRTVMHNALGFITGRIHGGYKWTGDNSVASSFDLVLERDASDTMAQRRGTNAQTFRLYNTYTSDTSFERLNVRWATNELIIDAEAGSGGGTLRGIKLGSATTSLLGFYGSTPVDQPLTVADPAGGGTVDSEARTAIGEIIDRLQELGLIA